MIKDNNTNKMINEDVQQEDNNKEFRMLGQGNTAEIYQYSNGKVMKLFRESMPYIAIQNEYRIARIVQEKLSNVPKAYALVLYRERYGIIYEQMIGSDMVNLIMRNIFKIKQYSRILARVHASIHEKEIDFNYPVKKKLSQDIDSCTDLTFEEKTKIKVYLMNLPDKNSICHFDYHPGNIMLCHEKTYIIDWMTACTGDPIADVARTRLLLQMGEMMHINLIKKIIIHITMNKISKTYVKEYQRQTQVTTEEVDAWVLPVAAARLSEWLSEHERKKLVLLVRSKIAEMNL